MNGWVPAISWLPAVRQEAELCDRPCSSPILVRSATYTPQNEVRNTSGRYPILANSILVGIFELYFCVGNAAFDPVFDLDTSASTVVVESLSRLPTRPRMCMSKYSTIIPSAILAQLKCLCWSAPDPNSHITIFLFWDDVAIIDYKLLK